MIAFLILQFALTYAGENCESIMCSNIIDHVCGTARVRNRTAIIWKFQNVCHLRKISCRLKPTVEITQIPNDVCNIRNQYSGRRLNDFSVVGAHQACNHTCPTYCVDAYEPACAQIWKRDMSTFSYRPMINHCHIDLFSCAVGVNVTIQPLGKCYNNPSGLLFMSQVAAMKSLKLLDDTPVGLHYDLKSINMAYTRRFNEEVERQAVDLLRRLIKGR